MSNLTEPVEIVEIRSRRAWRGQLTEAMARLESARRSLPWTVSSVVEGRLQYLAEAVDAGRKPTRLDRERGLALGVVALRNYAGAPEYCRLLLALANGYDRWAELPEREPASGAARGQPPLRLR